MGPAPPRGARLTRDGAIAAVLTLTLAGLALLSGNNLLYLLFGGLVSLWLLDALLGGWNLRHLQVRRALPPEIFAGRACPGALLVRNGRAWLPSADLTVREHGNEHRTHVGRVAPGQVARVRTQWRFADRGSTQLTGLHITSTFPLGLWRRSRTLEQPAEVLVFPSPSPAAPASAGAPARGDGLTTAGVGALGDLIGFLPYKVGDPPRRLHWPTTARAGQPMVVVRADEVATQVWISPQPLDGIAWERELSRACAQVLEASQRGYQIGLILDHERHGPRSGLGWRRTLLEHLALAPARGPAIPERSHAT